MYHEDRVAGICAQLSLINGTRFELWLSAEQLDKFDQSWREAKYYQGSPASVARNVRYIQTSVAEYPILDFNLRDVVLIQRQR